MITAEELAKVIALEDVLIEHLRAVMKYVPSNLRADIVINEDIRRLRQAPHRIALD